MQPALWLLNGGVAWLPAWMSRVKEFLYKQAFGSWDSLLFRRATWENLSYGFAVGLALVAAGLLLLELLLRRARTPISPRTAKRFGVALTILGFLSYFSFFNPNVRYNNYYHRHEFFHYYLGSKYSGELGYERIYECTAVAEIELGRGADLKTQQIRDLRYENLIKPIAETYVFSDPQQCTSHFEPERWAAFKQDIAWLEEGSRGTYWVNMKKDHGYNPPPVWTMTGKFFSAIGPANDRTFKLLATLDILLQLGTLGLLVWAFGWRVTAVASVFWGCNAAGNFYWTGGAFLRQDWLFFMVAAVCFAKKRKFELCGGSIVWAALLRVFPLVAAFGWLAMIALRWLRYRTLSRGHMRFLTGCLVAFAVLVPSSMVVVGPDSYSEFVRHIALHKNTPLTNHMGVDAILVHTWDGKMRFSRDDALTDPFEGWKQGRLDRTTKVRPVLLLGCLALALWIAWAVRGRSTFWIGLPLSVPLVMCVTNLTCYYFAMFIVFAPLVRLRPSLAPALLVAAAASQVLLARFYWIDDRYTALSYLYLAFALMPLIALSRPFTRARLRRWLSELRAAPRKLASSAVSSQRTGAVRKASNR